MSKFKDICKGFFGLQEVINVSAEKYDAIKDKIDPEVEVNITETELEEAQLINNLSDYNGHVMYQLRDPQEANAVAKDIQRRRSRIRITKDSRLFCTTS